MVKLPHKNVKLFLRRPLFRNSSENVARILKALIKFGFPKDSLDSELFTESGNIVRMGVPPARIELINKISGVTFEEVWGNRISGMYGKVSVCYIGKAELLKNKSASGRPKHIADVDELT